MLYGKSESKPRARKEKWFEGHGKARVNGCEEESDAC